MPELGKATYLIDADKTQFDRELAAAKAEAAAFAQGTKRELDKTQLGVDGMTASFLGLSKALKNELSPTGLSVLNKMGYLTDTNRQGITRLRNEIDVLRGTWQKLGTVMASDPGFKQAQGEIQKLDKMVQVFDERLQHGFNIKGFDTAEAERDLTRILAMQDLYMKRTFLRTVQFDQDLARRFGIQSGGTRGGPLSRLLGYLSGNVQAAKGPIGLTAEEQAILSALPVDAMGNFGGGGGGGTIIRRGGDNGGGGFNPLSLLFRRGRGFGAFPGPLGAFGGLSLGTMLGLGPEHILGVLASLGGSATGALGGAGTLLAGSLGKLLVGGGSDMAVMKSTISDVKTLYSAYQNVQQAVAVYGKNSLQAAQAQAQLNYQMKALGPAAKFEMAVAKQADQLNTLWDKATLGARKAATNILTQFINLGKAYVPLVAQAAQTNLTIINRAIKPLFAWLQGPQGISQWKTLEQEFAQGLPTAMATFTQAVEFIIKAITYASQYTGGFMRSLDFWFSKWNSPTGFLGVEHVINNLIFDFHVWWDFLKAAGRDLYGLFHAGVGEGNNLIQIFTGVLNKWGAWERSAAGHSFLHTFFYNREQEVIALGHAVSALARIFGGFYVAVQPLVPVVTVIAQGIGDIVNWIVDLGKHNNVIQDALVIPLGAFLLSWKMFGWGKTAAGVRSLAASLGILTAAEKANADMARVDAGAQMRLFGAESAGAVGAEGAGATGLAGLLSKGWVKGAIGVGGGVVAGNLAQGALGLRGGTAASIGGGVVGAGLGLLLGPLAPFGPIIGAMIGSGIGSTIGPTVAHFFGQLFGIGAGKDYGAQFAKGFVQPLEKMAPTFNSKKWQDAISKAVNTAHNGVGGGSFAQWGQMQFGGGASKLKNQNAFNVGWTIGNSVTAAITAAIQHGAHVTPAILENDFLPAIQNALAKGGPKAAAEAAKTMLMYAQSLQANGTLPKHAVKGMIDNLVAEFPALTNALKNLGYQNDQSLATALKFTQARNTLKSTIDYIGQQWAISTLSTKNTFAAMAGNIQQEAQLLQTALQSKNLAIRNDAKQSWSALQTATQNTMQNMTQYVIDRAQHMSTSIQQGNHDAAQSAYTNFNNLQQNIQAAMKNGLMSTTKGAEEIAKALNATLKAFGQKPIPFNLQAAAFAATMPAGVTLVSPGAVHVAGAATGGIIGRAGERGKDTVHALLGRGEAVLNYVQQGIVNKALSFMGIGGLSDLFKQTKGSLHYMASGGFAGYSLPLPRGDMMPGSWSIDQGVDIPAPAGTPEFAIAPGTIVGEGISGFGPNAPILRISSGPLAGLSVYYGHAGPDRVRVGASVRAGQQISEVGSGIVGISSGPHIEFGFYPPGGMGAGGAMAKLLTELMSGARITGVGTGGGVGGIGSWMNLVAPRVTGAAGTLKTLVEAAFHLMTRGANAYGSAHAGLGGLGSVPAGAWRTAATAIARHHGWGADQVRAWWGVEQLEDASLSLSAKNPTSPAYGLAQFIGGPSEYYSYGGNPNTLWGQLVAMANYIAGRYQTPSNALAFHRTHPYYAGGGLVGMAAGGGRHTLAHAASVLRHKNPKMPRPSHKWKLPKLKVGPDLGMAGKLLNAINALENNQITSLLNWQGYITSLHGAVPAEAVVQLANGMQVINWGNPDAALGLLTGVVDPTTGQVTKSIYDRLREIGIDGPMSEKMKIWNDPKNKNINTELGIDNQLLSYYLTEQSDAVTAWKYLAPYMDEQDLQWLDMILQKGPFKGTWDHKNPWFKKIGGTATHYKNQVAQILWAELQKTKLPAERAKRDASITARFARARHQVEISGMTSRFNASQWLRTQEAILSNEEARALAGYQNKPYNFYGSVSAWQIASRQGRASIQSEFRDRRLALQNTAARRNFTGMLSRSNALFGLSAEEAAEKAALTQAFDARSRNLSNTILKDRTMSSAEKRFLTRIDHELHQVMDSSGVRDQISQLLPSNTTGTLAINIDSINNIDIPNLLREAGSLMGTSVTSSAGADTAAQLANEQELLQNALESLYIANMQLPVFLGAYAKGTTNVPETGMALIHKGEAVIPAEINPFTKGGAAMPQLHIHGLGDFVDRVEMVVDGKKQEITDFVMHESAKGVRARRLLPAGNSGGSLQNAFGTRVG